MNDKILISQPTLPPLDDFVESLKKIWDNKWLTNNGEFHQIFEKELANFLGVKYLSLFSNGTLALITALQTLRITGEVITTPFSFVATSHSLYWNNIKPVFVDIEKDSCNLDPQKIEAAITPQTTAILPVHVYGFPCNITEIQKIADTYGLKVIYDAAHAFGVKVNNTSVLRHGDLSILSFHATKVFNTIEGGAIICHDIKTKQRIDYLKNFGFADEITVVAPGINAKMNEIQSAYGLLQLKTIKENIAKRKQLSEMYNKHFSGIQYLRTISVPENVEWNQAYYPVFIEKKYKYTRDEVYEKLKANNIFARRYFYPLISHMSTYRGLNSANPANLPTAEKIATEVLCLPIHDELDKINIDKIVKLIIE